ncbi:MAG: hypothetical protein M1825_000792 [Sarcosagium campestre]|nr:MAG: hypothetical protein M1825_000792 [Sarcosagium campestre]
MSPTILHDSNATRPWEYPGWRSQVTESVLVVEAWSQGFMVGGLVIMAGLTFANMGRRILHKLILIELLLAIPHGTFCFASFKQYGWYVSSTAVLCYSSWYLHNIIAWIKNKPFLSPRMSAFYIGTVILVAPYWVLEMYSNFVYNNNINYDLFPKTRAVEALFRYDGFQSTSRRLTCLRCDETFGALADLFRRRDPWWIFTCCNLVWNIKTRYSFGLVKLIQRCPRFGVMLVSMVLSIIFLLADMLCVWTRFGPVVGLDPYWKMSLIFKCFCDMIILDDFRSALDKLRAHVFDEPNLRGPPALVGLKSNGHGHTSPPHHDKEDGASPPRRKPNQFGFSGTAPHMKPITLVYSGVPGEPTAAKSKLCQGRSKRLGKMPRIPYMGASFAKIVEGSSTHDHKDGQIYVSTDVTLDEDSSSSSGDHPEWDAARNPYNTWPMGSKAPRKFDPSDW